jgi:SAM-dependent methyltransferase
MAGHVHADAAPSRALRWVPSSDPGNHSKLAQLENVMSAYYSTQPIYYQNIDFTATNWNTDPAYKSILAAMVAGARVLEVGCGRSNILHSQPWLGPYYSGTDLSHDLMAENTSQYLGTRFRPLLTDGQVPFADQEFDMVFSTFVLEHCVFPQRVLAEWVRVLKIGGRLMALCPDFLGRGRMTSQRAGWTAGTGRSKLRRGAWADALVTFWDNRVRIPVAAWRWRKKAQRRPQFLVNIAPTCFTDPFMPDVDAVYLTFESEIQTYLSHQIVWRQPETALALHLRRNKLILLDGVRVA